MSLSGTFNSLSHPSMPSPFAIDKRGRRIKTEEDYLVGERKLGDGSTIKVRGGKILSRHWTMPLGDQQGVEKKAQEDKKAALETSETRRSQRHRTHLNEKAKNFQL